MQTNNPQRSKLNYTNCQRRAPTAPLDAMQNQRTTKHATIYIYIYVYVLQIFCVANKSILNQTLCFGSLQQHRPHVSGCRFGTCISPSIGLKEYAYTWSYHVCTSVHLYLLTPLPGETSVRRAPPPHTHTAGAPGARLMRKHEADTPRDTPMHLTVVVCGNRLTS